jgi:hypothetical protein
MRTHSNELHPHLQSMFNQVVAGLASQGFGQSQIKVRLDEDDDTTVCAYRGAEGRRCAAGWLIKDEHYSSSFEERNIHDAYVQEALRQSGVRDDLTPFLSRLQQIHDDRICLASMRERLLDFAIDNDLVVPQELRP